MTQRTAEQAQARHKKLKLALKQWLLGRNYHQALKALAFAEKFHTGTRKDGVTPEFFHQIEIALFITTLEPFLIYPEETICAALLHDVAEDYNVEWATIKRMFDKKKFGKRAVKAVKALTKEYKGVKMSEAEYAAGISQNAIASIVKGVDRINNQQTMVGPFTIEKQKRYIEETEALILYAVRIAQDEFPEQHLAYESIKYMLKSQIQLIVAVHTAAEKV